jgi:hypothetical protein
VQTPEYSAVALSAALPAARSHQCFIAAGEQVAAEPLDPPVLAGGLVSFDRWSLSIPVSDARAGGAGKASADVSRIDGEALDRHVGQAIPYRTAESEQAGHPKSRTMRGTPIDPVCAGLDLAHHWGSFWITGCAVAGWNESLRDRPRRRRDAHPPPTP